MFAKFVCWLIARPACVKALFSDPKAVQMVADAVAQSIDFDRLARCVPVPPVADYIAHTAMLNYIGDIADRAAKLVTASDVANHIDTNAMADAVMERVRDTLDLDYLAAKAAKNIDVSAVADNIDKGRNFVKAVAEEIDLSNLAGELDYGTLTREMDIDYSEITSNLDNEAIAAEVQLDMNDLASEINMCDLASEISMSDLAEEINVSDVAAELDYEELAKALLAQFAETNAKAKAVEVRPSAS